MGTLPTNIEASYTVYEIWMRRIPTWYNAYAALEYVKWTTDKKEAKAIYDHLTYIKGRSVIVVKRKINAEVVYSSVEDCDDEVVLWQQEDPTHEWKG
jgi:hypothetical protein